MTKHPSVAPLPPIPSASRRERVVRALRDAITSGSFPPGHRLVEVDLAAQLGTSRAPIREALRQLEQEGLVASYPYHGTEVLGVSQEEIEQVLVPIRLTLERYAFLCALPLLTDDDFAELSKLIQEMHVAAEADNPDDVAEADIQFHELVIVRSRQPHCLQIWRTIQPRVRAYFRRDAPAHESAHTVADQHQQLLTALCSLNRREVLEAIDKHIHIYLSPEEDTRDER